MVFCFIKSHIWNAMPFELGGRADKKGNRYEYNCAINYISANILDLHFDINTLKTA